MYYCLYIIYILYINVLLFIISSFYENAIILTKYILLLFIVRNQVKSDLIEIYFKYIYNYIDILNIIISNNVFQLMFL